MKTVFRINGMTGDDIFKKLSQKHIDVEKSNTSMVLVTLHICITQEDVDALIDGVRDIANKYGKDEYSDE